MAQLYPNKSKSPQVLISYFLGLNLGLSTQSGLNRKTLNFSLDYSWKGYFEVDGDSMVFPQIFRRIPQKFETAVDVFLVSALNTTWKIFCAI